MREVATRLELLIAIGLDYLSLNRRSATLSGGESQRIRLSSQIGSGLMGMLYVLDEPSIGLHPKDNVKMIETLKRLRDLGNTVIVVEHDADTIRAADHILEIGPGPGVHGGTIVAEGPLQKILKDGSSLTGQYLERQEEHRHPRAPPAGERQVARRPRRPPEQPQEHRRRDSARAVRLRHRRLGLGQELADSRHRPEASLFAVPRQPRLRRRPRRAHRQRAHERRDRHRPIADRPLLALESRRPTSASTTRFARCSPRPTRRSKRGFTASTFSFNVKGGRCEECGGEGSITTQLSFMPDVEVLCPTCKGARYNQDTLEVEYQGKNIAEVLDLSVEDGVAFFAERARDRPQDRRARTSLGLGYLKLGHPSTILSGGEAQRVKLAGELGKLKRGKHNLYILDEPTTGLHFADIDRLLVSLNRLVDTGHSVVVIEHNLDVIKTADHVIDLGPEGGHKGGQLIACGTPEEIAACKASHTGKALVELLSPR